MSRRGARSGEWRETAKRGLPRRVPSVPENRTHQPALEGATAPFARTCRTTSPEETVALGKALGENHPQGGLFYLEGDLGSGKTLFAKGLASAYGVEPDEVVSPTFALVNRYGGGSRVVYHIDLYRIETERELAELGLEEMEEEEATVVVVEWAEKLGRFRRPQATTVRFSVPNENTREIRITETLREKMP